MGSWFNFKGSLHLLRVSSLFLHHSFLNGTKEGLCANFQGQRELSSRRPEIHTLLDTYRDVFSDPKTLPPSRTYDHTIPLIPGVVPVNSKPYMYSPQHKDEIERQVQEMLASGLIVPSTSPFPSPVLLIQKKDGI